jgi:ATP-binding cassette subfamily F protein uup
VASGILLAATGLTKAFGSRPLFEGISVSVDAGDRIGLIGPNGAGKSTLLSLLAGADLPDEGSVTPTRGLIVGFLAQVPAFRDGASIRETVMEGAKSHGEGEEEWKAGLAADEFIARLSLTADDRTPEMPVARLSGGWKKRVALARELVRRPDLLLLDEPTNHLDVEAILWLEGLLGRAPFATITVTHDRLFLQRVANRILELDPRNPGGLLDVRGNYETYLTVKEARLSADVEREASLRNRLRRETEWLRRGPKARSTKQQARIQRAEALGGEVEEMATRTRSSSVRIDFQSSGRSPKRLVEAKGIGKGYGGRRLFEGLNLLVTPESRIGLLGPNGCGKSTLLRVLLGTELPDTGEVLRAESLSPVVFEQGRESLDPDSTPAKTLCPEGDKVEFRGAFVHIKSYLDRFLFRPEQMDMAVGRLSGGEQSRLLIARLMLRKTNLLVLDEPTNDLDLGTLDVLEECLSDFPGAVLLVTHDRWFLDRVTNQILAFGKDAKGNGTLVSLAGLDQWEAWRAGSGEPRAGRDEERTQSASLTATVKKKRLGYLEQREMDGMEERILTAEEARDALKAECDRPENATDGPKLVELFGKLQERQVEVDRLYARWDELHRRASEAEGLPG